LGRLSTLTVKQARESIISDGWSILDTDTKPAKALLKSGTGSILNYQKNQIDEALSYVKKFDCAIDGGANYGFITYHLQQFKQVHAFEFYAPVSECLEKNVVHFNMSNTQVHHCGLGQKNKKVSVSKRTTFGNHVHPTNTGDVNIIPLDSLDLDACDFIKLDCEGYESFILRGASDTISKFKPVILMEYTDLSDQYYGISKETQINILLKQGYQILKQFKKDIIMGPIWQ